MVMKSQNLRPAMLVNISTDGMLQLMENLENWIYFLSFFCLTDAGLGGLYILFHLEMK